MRSRVLALSAALAGLAAAPPAGGADELRAAVRKLSESGSYAWSVNTSNAGETSERYSVGPLEGKTEKGGLTWLRSRETPPVEVVLKGSKMAVRLDDGWALEQDLASGSRARGHANLTVLRSLKSHAKPAAQASSLLKHAKDLKEEQPGYFTSPIDDAGVKELLHQSLRTSHNPEISAQDGTLAFWIRDGVLIRYEVALRGTVTYPAPAASTWTADLRINVEISAVGATPLDIPDDARKKLE
jgi:hypothetical protein